MRDRDTSRAMSHALRHEPGAYGLTLAGDGSVLLADGFRPMGRQYVHLTSDRGIALQAGRRKASDPVLLRIDSTAAVAEGVRFSEGNDRVTLADFVPAAHITVATDA